MSRVRQRTYWNAVSSQQSFNGWCRCDDLLDNGAGLSWTVTLAPGESASFAPNCRLAHRPHPIDLSRVAPSSRSEPAEQLTTSLR